MTTRAQDEGPPEPYTGGPLPQPKQTRKRKHKRIPANPDSESEGTASMAMDMEDYQAQEKFNWELGLKVKLHRNSPTLFKGMQVGGHLETRENAPYTFEEIKERFGGGMYEIFISGPKQLGDRPTAIGRKQFSIAGDPSLENLPIHVQAVSAGMTPGQQQGGSDQVSPQAQASLVGLLGKQLDKQDESRTVAGADPDLFREMRQSVEGSAQSQVEVIKDAAEKEAALLKTQLEELRQNNEKLRAETEALRQQSQHAVDSARTESSSLLSTLIPTFSNEAHQRSQQAMQDADARCARMQDQHSRDVAAVEQRAQMQIDNMRAMFDAQLLNQATVFEGRIKQLETELALARARGEHFENEARQLQGRNTELLMKQMEKADPVKQAQYMATLKETLGALGGGGDEGGGLSDEASDAMKMIYALSQGFGPVASALSQRLTGAAPPGHQMPEYAQPPMPQHVPPHPPQLEPAPRALTRPAPRQMQRPQRTLRPPERKASPQPQPQQAAPPPQPKPAVRLRKADLANGVGLLNAAMLGGTPPVKAADAAAQQLDRPTMRELAKRKPQAVYDSLATNDLLEGPLATPDGAAYLTEFLIELRARLSGTTYEPPQQEAEPGVQPEAPPDVHSEDVADAQPEE